MGWEVEGTDEFRDWYGGLTNDEQDAVVAAAEMLVERGPSLGRPFADTIQGSRHANMKELRPKGYNIRVLFAFDPRRTAILLSGGDKTNRWAAWYAEMIPTADRLFDEYLDELQREGLI